MTRLRLPWYKRDHREMLAQYRRLGPELGGALSAFVDLCCSEGGVLEIDDRYLAGQLGVDVRKWKRFRTELVQQGELYECFDPETGRPAISALIADRIIQEGRKLIADSRRAGKISAQKRAQKRATFEGASFRAPEEQSDFSLGISQDKSIIRNNLDSTPVQRPFGEQTRKSRKENKVGSGSEPIGKVISELDMPILQNALRNEPDRGSSF